MSHNDALHALHLVSTFGDIGNVVVVLEEGVLDVHLKGAVELEEVRAACIGFVDVIRPKDTLIFRAILHYISNALKRSKCKCLK